MTEAVKDSEETILAAEGIEPILESGHEDYPEDTCLVPVYKTKKSFWFFDYSYKDYEDSVIPAHTLPWRSYKVRYSMNGKWHEYKVHTGFGLEQDLQAALEFIAAWRGAFRV